MPHGGLSLGGVLPEGQGEADNGYQGGHGWQGPPGAFEVVESLVVVGELPVGLVAALYEQGEGSVDAGEPFGHRAAQLFELDGDGLGRGWLGHVLPLLSSTRPRPTRSSSCSTLGRAMTRARPPASLQALVAVFATGKNLVDEAAARASVSEVVGD